MDKALRGGATPGSQKHSVSEGRGAPGWHPWPQERAKEPAKAAATGPHAAPQEEPGSPAGRKPLLSASRSPVIKGNVFWALASGEFRSHEARRVVRGLPAIREVGRGQASPPALRGQAERCALNLAASPVLFMRRRPEIQREFLPVDVLASLESKKQKYLSHNSFCLGLRRAHYVIVT